MLKLIVLYIILIGSNKVEKVYVRWQNGTPIYFAVWMALFIQ